MVRRTLAAFLVLSWVVLSGIDVLEDLDLPFNIEFEIPAQTPGPAAKRNGLAHNMTEFAHTARTIHVGIFRLFTVEAAGHSSDTSGKPAKLYKSHQVFLI
jgi:hypothetical protein